MVFFDVPRGGHSHNILRADGPRPHLPLLILGVVGVALFASFILKASDDIVFVIVFIGCLTAFLEIKMRNDNRE
jgi:hypothetical protein